MSFFDSYINKMRNILNNLSPYELNKIGLMCLERQFKTCYTLILKLPLNKENRTIIYREVLDKLWYYILYNEPISEDEYCKIENINYFSCDDDDIVDTKFIYIFSDNLLSYMCNIWEYDELIGGLPDLVSNIDFILTYIDDENPDLDLYENHILIQNEIKNQVNNIEEQKNITTFELAKRWYENCNTLL